MYAHLCTHVPVLGREDLLEVGLQVDVSCPTGVLGNFGHLQGQQVFLTAEPHVSPAPISQEKKHLSCCLRCRREKISYWVVTCFWKSVRWFFVLFCGFCVCVCVDFVHGIFYWLNVEESKWNFVIILNSAGAVVGKCILSCDLQISFLFHQNSGGCV